MLVALPAQRDAYLGVAFVGHLDHADQGDPGGVDPQAGH